jgi:hypothetical protein
MSRNEPLRRALAAASAVLALGLGACSATTGENMQSSSSSQVRDAAGQTQAEVAKLSLQEEFELYGQRYEHANKYLEQAQRALDAGEWEWTSNGLAASAGDGLAGTTSENSYSLSMSRAIQRGSTYPDATVTKGLEEFFTKQGWSIGHDQVSGDEFLAGFTDDGYTIEYVFRDNGRISVEARSSTYWTNDSLELGETIHVRLKEGVRKQSKPGESIPYPRWEDPVARSTS